ncbi:MAG: hypothetical protein U1F83_04875 [Verrucomicrobiota bacterium]
MNYPEKDFPWTFYFNGAAMPKWGWCWSFSKYNDPQKSWDWDVGPRDIYILECRIDHVGTIESADPDLFRYAVQESLCILLDNKESVFEDLRKTKAFPAKPEEIYEDLVEASFQMRELTIRNQCAFWTRGYESDRLKLMESMRRAFLPAGNPEFEPAPHIRSIKTQLKSIWRGQAKKLHRVAASGGLSKEIRKRLLGISADVK